MNYYIKSIRVGRLRVPAPQVFWMNDWGNWCELWLQVVLIRGNGVVALVNTGPGKDIAPLQQRWRSRFGDDGGLRRDASDDLLAALAAEGVAPTDVTHVLLTPLQLYTTGNVTAFPNAQVCISTKGWIHFHTFHDHPHDSRWLSMSRDLLVHLVTDGWDRVRLLEDEDSIAPGLRTWWCGVHHRASIVVEADTDRGTVAISDCMFYFANVEGPRVLGLNESLEETKRAYARLRSSADHLLPLYDPTVFDRYPGGVICPG